MYSKTGEYRGIPLLKNIDCGYSLEPLRGGSNVSDNLCFELKFLSFSRRMPAVGANVIYRKNVHIVITVNLTFTRVSIEDTAFTKSVEEFLKDCLLFKIRF